MAKRVGTTGDSLGYVPNGSSVNGTSTNPVTKPDSSIGSAVIIGIEVLLLSTFVLMKQNRMSKLADRRAHLNLQINLLIERESTKIIGMLLEIGKRLDIQHKMLDEESSQLSRLLAIETLIETLHSKFPDR